MLFEQLDYPNFRAFMRLVYRKVITGSFNQDRKKLTFLATEHGISREEARELYKLCLERVRV